MRAQGFDVEPDVGSEAGGVLADKLAGTSLKTFRRDANNVMRTEADVISWWE